MQPTIFICTKIQLDRSLDLYLALMTPDNNLLFFPGWNSFPEPLNLSIPKGTDLKDVEIFEIPISNSIPEGTYFLYCGICEAGTTKLIDKLSLTEFRIH